MEAMEAVEAVEAVAAAEAAATVVNNKSEFTCKCGARDSKSKKALKVSGPFCKGCTQHNASIKRIKNKIALNNEMLSNWRGK